MRDGVNAGEQGVVGVRDVGVLRLVRVATGLAIPRGLAATQQALCSS